MENASSRMSTSEGTMNSPTRTKSVQLQQQAAVSRLAAPKSPPRLSPNTSSFVMKERLTMKGKTQEGLAATNITPFNAASQRAGGDILNSGGSVAAAPRTIVNVNVSEARVFKSNGMFVRQAYLNVVMGTQIRTLKSAKFMIDGKGVASYVFEQKCVFNIMDDKDIAAGVEIFLSSTDRRDNQIGSTIVQANKHAPLSQFQIGQWALVFPPAPAGGRAPTMQANQAVGEVKIAVDCKVEDFLSDSESDNSSCTATPCSVSSTANMMRLTATGTKENNTPIPTPTVNIESRIIRSEQEDLRALQSKQDTPLKLSPQRQRQPLQQIQNQQQQHQQKQQQHDEKLFGGTAKGEASTLLTTKPVATTTISAATTATVTTTAATESAITTSATAPRPLSALALELQNETLTENCPGSVTSTAVSHSPSPSPSSTPANSGLSFVRVLLPVMVALVVALLGSRLGGSSIAGQPKAPPVRVMEKNSTVESSSSSSSSTTSLPSSAPATTATTTTTTTTTTSTTGTAASWATSGPTLMVSLPHGKQIQVVDGSDGACLHWKRGPLGGHARFTTCNDHSWWTVKPGVHGLGLQVEHANGKCLCPRSCSSQNTGLTLKSCDRCACAEGWVLSEQTGQLSKPVWGRSRPGEPLTESLSCLSRKAERKPNSQEGRPFGLPFNLPDFAKAKATLKLCYMSEAVANAHAVSPTATTSSKGHVDIQLSKYYRLAIAGPQ